MDHVGLPRHRGPVPPRRWLAVGGAFTVTALAVAGSLGIGPGDARGGTEAGRVAEGTSEEYRADSSVVADEPGGLQAAPAPTGTATAPPAEADADGDSGRERAADAATRPAQQAELQSADLSVPAHSGQGRRVVYDESAQRVWLVRENGSVARTYPVSGGRNPAILQPGRYDVYSMSRHAISYNYLETMQFMVRFAYGRQAPIGFHDIPRDLDGERVQTRAQLGTPLSAGCVRQARPDAVALWEFARVGTRVVVIA